MLDVNPEERVERLDFDVEALHQRDRHGPQIREAAANRDLRHVTSLSADCCQEFRELVDEPGRKIVAPRHFRVLSNGGHVGRILISPRQLARAEQRAIPYEREARDGGIESDVRLDPAGHRDCLSRSSQAQKGVGWGDERSNADASLDERPERGRHLVRIGEREHYSPAIYAFDRRRHRRDIGDRAARVHPRVPGRRQSFGPHRFVGTVGHDDLPVIASNTPHDDRDRPAGERRKLPVDLRTRRWQDGMRPHTRDRRAARHDIPAVELDEPARDRRQFNTDARAQVPRSSRPRQLCRPGSDVCAHKCTAACADAVVE